MVALIVTHWFIICLSGDECTVCVFLRKSQTLIYIGEQYFTIDLLYHWFIDQSLCSLAHCNLFILFRSDFLATPFNPKTVVTDISLCLIEFSSSRISSLVRVRWRLFCTQINLSSFCDVTLSFPSRWRLLWSSLLLPLQRIHYCSLRNFGLGCYFPHRIALFV